jgi:RNase adaptor protein for sRNA GlmZ degradation
MLWDSDLAVFNIMTNLGNGNNAASVQTTCHAGTHRSVTAAEIIAQRLRSLGVHNVRIACASSKEAGGFDLIKRLLLATT